MTILQTIQNMSEDTDDSKEMYFHSEGVRLLYDGYYNLFAAHKWVHYTKLKTLYVHLSSSGGGIAFVMSEKGPLMNLQMEESSPAGTSVVCALLPEWQLADYLWVEWEPTHERDLLEGFFFTEDVPEQEVHLASVVCTYRRETFVKRNMQVLRDGILDNPNSPVYEKLELFITDNGGTLDQEDPLFAHDKIHLIKNRNAGGSGGFCRGMLEVLEKKEKRFTHTILMDDDIKLSPETLVRTYAVLSYLRDQYRKSCIGGELIDIEVPYLLNEAGACFHHGFSEIPLRGTDLRIRSAVMEVERIRHSDYAGWWFACYPMEVVREDNLPLPFFIHFDDIEYGLRNATGIIYLNGISVRHADFTKRYSAANLYYTVRNRLITNALRCPGMDVKEEIACIRDMVLFELLRYSYSNVGLILLAVEDFCKGAGAFSRIDPELKNNQVRSIAGVFQPFEEIAETKHILEQLKEYADHCQNDTGYIPKSSKIAYRITLNGWLLPSHKGRDEAFASVFHMDMRELFRCKEGVLVDPYTRKGMIVRKDYRKLLSAACKLIRIENLMRKRYEKAADSYRRYEKRMENKRFWRKYLQLSQVVGSGHV